MDFLGFQYVNFTSVHEKNDCRMHMCGGRSFRFIPCRPETSMARRGMSPKPYTLISFATSTQPVILAAASSSGIVTSTALLRLPAAGNTVSKRLRDSSR